MFIAGPSASKQRQAAAAAAVATVPLRPTDTNKLETTGNRRKTRKPIQIIQEIINQNNENRSSLLADRRHAVGFNDDGDTSSPREQHVTADDESHSPALDIDSTHDSTTTTTVSVIERGKATLHYHHAISGPTDCITVLSKAMIDAFFARLSDWTTFIRELRSTYYFRLCAFRMATLRVPIGSNLPAVHLRPTTSCTRTLPYRPH